MRFASAALAASTLLLSGSFAPSPILASAQECSCPAPATQNGGGDQWNGNTNNNNNNGGSTGGSISGSWTPPTSYDVPIKTVPKVKATKKTLENGAQKAIEQLTNKNILPPSIAEEVQKAINDAIAQHVQPQVVASVAISGTTSVVTVIPSATVIPSTVTVDGSVSTVYMTQTVTAMPPGATILSNKTINALDSIEDAIRDAVAAVDLSKSNLDAAAQAELQKCLNAVLQNGGLPEGYSCISQSGSTSAGLKTTFNNILEQFLGILPAKIIDEIQDAVMPMMTDLLPDETTLLSNINSAMKSVISSLSGDSVTAIEMMQSCYSLAIKQNSNSSYLQCYMSDGGPFDTLQNAMNSVIQQFVGYLPGTVLESVKNLTSSTLTAGAYGELGSIGTNLTSQLDNALASVTSSLTGNSVTLMQQLQSCANLILKDGDATAAKNCLAQAPAQTARTMVNSVAEQFSGYLPSSFFSDLVSIVDGMDTTATGGNFTKTQVIDALEKANNNANMGPAFVGCFEQVQDCIVASIASSGDYKSTCPGPVAGCELIGSNNSTSLANSTLASEISAASVAAATSIIVADNSTSSAVSSASSASAIITSSSSAASSAAPTSVSSSSEASSSASSAVSTFSSDPIVAVMKASSASSSSSSSSSAPAESSSSSSAPAKSSSSSSADATSPAPSSSGTESSAGAPSSTVSSSAFKAKMVRKRNSHQKLRMMYSEHYNRV